MRNTLARHYWQKGHVPWNKGIKGRSYPGSEATQFKKGQASLNALPIGTEVFDTDGYLKVKVAEPNKWEYKHRMVWEEANGLIPGGQT